MRKNHLRWSRRICLLLSALLLAGSALTLVSCGDAEEPLQTEESLTEASTSSETVVETEGPSQTLDVPDVNFNGYTFRALSIDRDAMYTMLDVEKITSEPVNDAIYERNRLIEDRFGIQFECEGDDWPNMFDHLSLQVNSGNTGSDAYDLIMLICRDAYKATLNNLLLPYARLEYIDIDKDYYFQEINEKYRLGEHTFFAYGKENLNVMAQSCGLIFNKDIAKDIHTDDLYSLVRNQEWTYSKLFEYAEAAASDVNGDSQFELGTDRLGMIGHYDVTVPDFWVSAGEFLVEKDENHLPVSNMFGNERLINIMQETLNHIDGDAYSVLALGDVEGAFMQDQALFFSSTLSKLYDLRSMETDYGVLPFPKYDTAQENYITRNIDGWLHCVPATCKDTEMTGIIMQAIAYYSNKTVYDAYYEQALTTKFMRDSDSVEMVKLMLDTVQVDIGDTIWYDYVRLHVVNKMVENGSQTGLSSLFRSTQRQADQRVADAIKYIDSQNE